jgi:radical SAM protein with 4Fe4S-binding SPASM domain
MTTGYGGTLLHPTALDRAPKLKNRVLGRIEPALLRGFGWISDRSELDRPMARWARRSVGPFLYSLKLELDTRCMLRCRMCYVERSRDELRLETLTELFEQLSGARVRIEILGGEPLLREDILEIVARAKRVAKAPFVSLYTNGVLVEPDLARGLSEAGLDAVLVTLVSPREAVHDAFCGMTGAFRKTVRGIRLLREAGHDVYTFTAVHRENHRECSDLARYVQQELGARPTFYQYVPHGMADSLDIPPEEWASVKHWVLSQQNPEHMHQVRRFCLLTGNGCSGGNFVLTVKADGSVQPCPFVSDLALGNIHQQDIWSIYRSRFARPEWLEFKCLPAECEPCSYRDVCGGGCRAASRRLFGSYARRDHKCLGPYSGPLDKRGLTDYLPTFF